VADGPAGLVVLDLTDPRQPARAFEVDLPGDALGIAADGDLAYVAVGPEGVRVVDLEARAEVGAVDTPVYAWDVALDGATAYVSDRQGGVRVLGLANPEAPQEVASVLEGAGDVLDIVALGDRLWVAAGTDGLHVFDVRDPTKPLALGHALVEDRAIGIVRDGDLAYVASGTAGLRVLDLGDPTQPREVAGWAMPGAAERLVRLGDWFFVAAETGGLQIVDRRRE